MANIAIIPARGGSKRIPRKNIKAFLGKPIIEYSIKCALESGLFDEVMVSTDDLEIAQISKKVGAKVPFYRSELNADDYATTPDVLLEVLKNYSDLGRVFESACCIYPTAPLLTKEKLQIGYNLLTGKKFSSVFPVVQYSYPIWRSLKIEDDKATMNWEEYKNSRSQDLPNSYHDAGMFYWFKIDKFLKENKLFSSNSGVVVLSEIEVQDIDTFFDWQVAEMKYKVLVNET